MKVNLRKANALQLELSKISFAFDANVKLNEFSNVENMLRDKENELDDLISHRTLVLDALYELRKQISVANVTAGVDNLLADAARCDKDLAFYQRFLNISPRVTDEEIKGRLDRIRTRTETHYYDRDVDTSIYTAEDIKKFADTVQQIKRKKTDIQDKLLATNVENSITLSDSVVSTLTLLKLI